MNEVSAALGWKSMKPTGYTLRLALHATALALEALGTLFVLFDYVRINERASEVGDASAGHEPEWLYHWYYHSAMLGFALLFAGILFAAVVLWFEHWEHVQSIRKETQTHPSASPPPPGQSTSELKPQGGSSVGS